MNSPLETFADAPLARRMLELSPVASVVLDNHGHVVFVNEKLMRMLGYSSDQLVGQSVSYFLPGVSSCDSEARPARTLSQPRNGATEEEEWMLARHRLGATVPVAISRHEITGPNELILLRHLARAIKEQSETELFQSERLAAIAQMIRGLAHESRNALQRAVACLDLLELDLIDNPAQMILSKQIRDSLADLLHNYDEVRRYSEPMVIAPRQASLMQVCQLAFDELSLENEHAEKIEANGLFSVLPHRLTFADVTNRNDVACVDREKMKSVFRHVLENAIQAADSNARIEVSFHPTRLNQSEAVRVTTRDHGSGFDDETLRHAFDPFFTTKLHGTGLGLAICRRILEAHRGEINAKNHASGGALVEITLPIKDKRCSS